MPKKILIIDDEKELCHAIVDYLNEAGYYAYEAHTGKEGIEAIERIHPNLVLLDIRMPEMDGVKVMRDLIKKYPNLVVIVLSGHYDPELSKRVIQYGACEFLTKPVKIEQLEERYIRPLLQNV